MEVIDSRRIEELRRRMQKDPTSIAFAQLAEEYRRAGNFEEAISTCRSGLAHHPSYISARVTLGRSLMELHRYTDARSELEAVLGQAPDNLAAIRALAEIHQRRGAAGESFHNYTPAVDSEPDEAPAAPADGPLPRTTREYVAAPTTTEKAVVAPTPEVAVVAPTLVDDAPTTAPGPLEALDALDALTLDLPPTPDFSSWTLDTEFSTPDASHAEPPAGGESVDAPVSDPVIATLERWLTAIVEDRSNQL